VKKVLTLSLVVFVLQVTPASAQLAPELLRFQWISGVLMQGSVASGEMISDFTQFVESGYTERSGGELSVDTGLLSGIEVTYRLGSRLTVGASWMHSRARYRLEFPALASDPGNFDFESFLLMSADWVQDFQGGSRPTQGMSDAITDIFLASVTYEIPLFERKLFPYWTLGGGIFRQTSDGEVFRLQYEGDPPPFYEILDVFGLSPEETAYGVPVFSVKETNPVIAAGMGFRVSFSGRWSAELRLQDFIRLSPDLSEFDVGTPAPDPEEGRVYSVTLRPEEGMIHNFGVHVSLAYSLWPFGAPR
jgi:hypothetical protein